MHQNLKLFTSDAICFAADLDDACAATRVGDETDPPPGPGVTVLAAEEEVAALAAADPGGFFLLTVVFVIILVSFAAAAEAALAAPVLSAARILVGGSPVNVKRFRGSVVVVVFFALAPGPPSPRDAAYTPDGSVGRVNVDTGGPASASSSSSTALSR